MDDMKIFAKNEKNLEPQIKTIGIYSLHLRMEFTSEKCDILITKQLKEQNDQIKQASEPLAKKIFQSNKEYWKRIPSNKNRWKTK